MSELDVSDLVTVDRAIEIIDALPVRPRELELPLTQAMGLRLAETVCADRDCPPWEKSLMDGYAVRAADVAVAPVDLRVVGQAAAGHSAGKTVGAGEAMTIMTGAPIPAGADCVVPIEQTDSPDGPFASVGNTIKILRAASVGQFIARRGGDIAAGAEVLRQRMMIGPAQIAAAAFVGKTIVKAYDRPRVAVLGTGDELVGFDQTPRGAEIRNANNPMLVALLTRLGCTVRDLGFVGDQPAAIKAAIADGLAEDCLFVTGGMSRGQHDHVPRILREMGGELRITKLRIRPGKPFVLAAMPGSQVVFGLPGNPVSAFVCTVRLAARWLRRLAGGSADEGVVWLPLAVSVAANGPREFYQPATLQSDGVRPLPLKGSADIFTLARAQVLFIRNENDPALPAGAMVRTVGLPT
jgi:molybdopterin molybdotransferase